MYSSTLAAAVRWGRCLRAKPLQPPVSLQPIQFRYIAAAPPHFGTIWLYTTRLCSAAARRRCHVTTQSRLP